MPVSPALFFTHNKKPTLVRGSHLAILSENRLEWVLAQMGAGLIGAITVGVYPTSPTPEVAYVLAIPALSTPMDDNLVTLALLHACPSATLSWYRKADTLGKDSTFGVIVERISVKTLARGLTWL
jgi:hypothetical protein